MVVDKCNTPAKSNTAQTVFAGLPLSPSFEPPSRLDTLLSVSLTFFLSSARSSHSFGQSISTCATVSRAALAPVIITCSRSSYSNWRASHGPCIAVSAGTCGSAVNLRIAFWCSALGDSRQCFGGVPLSCSPYKKHRQSAVICGHAKNRASASVQTDKTTE